ncbi:hypothetical protein ACFLV3_04530 [Chloroflexota bacterium]
MGDVKLPAIVDISIPALSQLTAALGVPREILASDDEIRRAWKQLPRLIGQISPESRNELHARMCVAVSTGLFDASVNYIWNSAILALRDKIRGFGLYVVPQITGNQFDEEKLLDLTDSQLIQLCLSLNLISEDAYFFLDQCRDVRNNFSAAHPPMGALDDAEFIVFLTRCIKYALSSTSNPKGVNTQALIQSVKDSLHTSEQTQEWIERINATHDAQQKIIITMLHGIYCDATSTQDTRNNALAICKGFSQKLSPAIKSELINRHSDYSANGKTTETQLSQQFFAHLTLLGLLSDQERHILVSRASKKLIEVHEEWHNFYNEPPFAERLREIQTQTTIPRTARVEFVTAVVTCAVGNQYGISRVAYPTYLSIIRDFTPAEIAIMLDLPNTKTSVGVRYKEFASCRDRFKQLVQTLDPKSVPVAHTAKYKAILGI